MATQTVKSRDIGGQEILG